MHSCSTWICNLSVSVFGTTGTTPATHDFLIWVKAMLNLATLPTRTPTLLHCTWKPFPQSRTEARTTSGDSRTTRFMKSCTKFNALWKWIMNLALSLWWLYCWEDGLWYWSTYTGNTEFTVLPDLPWDESFWITPGPCNRYIRKTGSLRDLKLKR